MYTHIYRYRSDIRKQIPNRHSPQTWAPIIQHVTWDYSSFAFQYWDLDGNMLRPYPYGSTDTISGAPDVVCLRYVKQRFFCRFFFVCIRPIRTSLVWYSYVFFDMLICF